MTDMTNKQELEAIQKATQDAIDTIKGLVENQDKEIKQAGAASAETSKALETATKAMEQLQADYKGLQERLDKVEVKGARPGYGGPDERKTAGEVVVESAEYKRYIESGARGESTTISTVEKKDISTNTTAAGGALTTPFIRDEILGDTALPPTFVMDLLPAIPVDSDAVQLFRELLFDNEAGPQWDQSSGNKQLVDKPKSNITFESVTVPVETIAHYIITSRQIIADVNRLRGYVDGRLWYGLRQVLDEMILYGDGSGGEFMGFFEDPAVTDIGGFAPPATGTSEAAAMIDHFRKGITALQKFNYYRPTGAVISPEDWEKIETAKGSDGHYVWVNVANGADTRLWRVPIVPTNAVQEHDFLIADFNLAAAMYVREAYTVRVSEHHANLFVKNGLAILGEQRAALGIELPHAAVRGVFTEGPASS